MAKFLFVIVAALSLACDRADPLDVGLSSDGKQTTFGTATGSAETGSGNAVAQGAQGYTTSGNEILSPEKMALALSGLNWSGFETANKTLTGLDHVNVQILMQQIKTRGFNVLRIPVTLDVLTATSPVSKVDGVLNPTLAGSTPLELLDHIVTIAKFRNIRIILAVYGCGGPATKGLWYSSSCSEATWLKRLGELAGHFASADNLLGVEPHAKPSAPAQWGGNDETLDFRRAVVEAGKAILAANPSPLVIVGCVLPEAGSSCAFPHDPAELIADPLLKAKIIYSAQADLATDVDGRRDLWEEDFGFIHSQKLAPVMLSSFHVTGSDQNSVEWVAARELVSYISANKMPWTYWELMYSSDEAVGLLMNDYMTFDRDRQRLLDQIIR